ALGGGGFADGAARVRTSGRMLPTGVSVCCICQLDYAVVHSLQGCFPKLRGVSGCAMIAPASTRSSAKRSGPQQGFHQGCTKTPQDFPRHYETNTPIAAARAGTFRASRPRNRLFLFAP